MVVESAPAPVPRLGALVLAMTAVMALDTSDQSAIGATALQVQDALGINQGQIGLLATSSTLVGVAFTIPFGILADRRNRVRLLRATVVLWSIAAVGVGLSPNFGLMVAAHAVLGLVTGAGGPLVASLVGDAVPPDRRGRVFSLLLLGELMGSALGLVGAGEIAALVGWREAYWALAGLGVLTFVLLSRTTEPPRRTDRPRQRLSKSTDAPGSTRSVSFAEAVRLLARNRTYLVIIAASALGYYFFAGVQTFAVSLLNEAYGVSEQAAPVYVLMITLSLAVGVLVGGPAGDRLLRRHGASGRLPLVLVAFGGSLIFIVPALASSALAVTVPLLIVGGLLLGSANPALDASRIEVVPALLLGRAEAIRTALKDGADATAPLLFGVLGVNIGLQNTFLLMSSALGFAFVFCVMAVRSYPRDVISVAPSTVPGKVDS